MIHKLKTNRSKGEEPRQGSGSMDRNQDQYYCHVSPSVSCDNDTALPLVEVLIILSIISIKMDLLLNSNYKRRKPEFPGSSGISIVFRLVAYLQNMICLKLIIIPKLTYISFGIILTHFYIKISRQEHQIDVLYVSFKT